MVTPSSSRGRPVCHSLHIMLHMTLFVKAFHAMRPPLKLHVTGRQDVHSESCAEDMYFLGYELVVGQ